MDNTDFFSLLKEVNQKFNIENRKHYEPFVRRMRFPRYKGLYPDSEMNFDFPLTVLVGVNGSNKTSVLQALYGVPANQNVGNYWFFTAVDKINNSWQHCLIYSYHHAGAGKQVEVIKTRISKTKNDYWEPSRPIKKYRMEIPKEKELISAGNKSKTRWDLIDKSVVFCDFKEYISAFDMYFYNYIFEPDAQYKSKQDFLRERSAKLSKVVSEKLSSYFFGSIERVETNFTVSDEVKNVVSWMLDQKYDEIQIVSHKFYARKNIVRPLKTILMRKSGRNYTEAFAGSGESRLIMLVNDIVNAPKNSLILIDEPEINLHPSAILRFKTFLLQQILKKNHQIVLSTHSAYLVSNLPKSAIKLFQTIENQIAITENVDYNDAFVVLGESIRNKAKIIVEDKLAKEIIEFGIRKSDTTSMCDALEVQYVPGGVSTIINRYIYASAMRDELSTFYVLDGDTNHLFNNQLSEIESDWINDGYLDSREIPTSKNENLSDIIKELTGSNIQFSTNSGGNRQAEKYYMQRKFIDFWRSNVKFLNSSTPEMALLESKKIELENDEDSTGKDFFKNHAENELGKQPTSEEILVLQQQMLNSLDAECPLRVRLDEITGQIWSDFQSDN